MLTAVVGEWDPKVVAVAQDFVAVGVEPVKQVDVLGSFAFATSARVVVGVGCPAGVDELVITAPTGREQLRAEVFRVDIAGRVHGAVDLDEQPVQPWPSRSGRGCRRRR